MTTEALLAGYPLTLAVLRALPAGLLLLCLTRCLPPRVFLGRVFALGALNFAVFWSLLFVAAYRLPGGVAATLGAMAPLMVIVLSRRLLGTTIRSVAVVAALSGVFGVALLLLGPEAALHPICIAAGLGGAASMLGMMSPLTAVILGWLWLGQGLTPQQLLGAAIFLASVGFGQAANLPRRLKFSEANS